ncbi:unnamed protein product [Arabidopsis lyrata]|nr:unnamed protein product [Arabidopsis lyrata]
MDGSKGLSTERLKEDRISQLPDPLICHILSHLPTKEAVTTSVLSTRFFDSDRVSCIHKLKLAINGNGDGVDDTSYIKSWIDAAVKPLDDVEFVSFPRLKTMHLLCVRLSKDAAFERFISCCPVLEDLRIAGCVNEPLSFRVHSQSLKRLIIGRGNLTHQVDSVPGVVIDAPQLCCLRIIDHVSKSFIVNNLEYNAKLEVNITFGLKVSDEESISSGRSLIHSFLSGILKVGDLTINSDTLKIIYDYSKSESLPQFGYMSRLCVSVMAQYLTWLEPFLKSCPNLRSLVLVFPNSLPERMNQINFSCVPKCLQSSVEFVDLKFQISGPVTEMKMKLVRYFLENSAILKKLTLHMYSNSTEDEILTKLLQIPRASTKCEVVIVIKRRIHHIDLSFDLTYQPDKIPPLTLRLYTCETLVHLRLYGATLVDAEFVALPCLKILHLEYVSYPNESTLEKLISGSPVLKDLTIIRYLAYNAKVLRVRSQTVKKIHIDHSRVVIDAPLLQSLRTKIYKTKNFEIINLGFFTKLDIDVVFISHRTYYSSMIHDIITDISMVKELVINNGIWKDIFLYSKSGPVQQFRNLSSLNAGFTKTDLELLPLILESCPKLESLTLELVEDQYMRCEKNKEPNVMFSTVPQCLVSSLKFVELKRSIPMYEGEMELVRYLLKNSTILKKLRLDLYYSQRAMGDFLKELFAMPKCSTGCEVLVL